MSFIHFDTIALALTEFSKMSEDPLGGEKQ
jgi:hypothetical protein